MLFGYSYNKCDITVVFKDIIAYVWFSVMACWYHFMGITWLLSQTEECTTEECSFFTGFKSTQLTATNLGVS